MDTASTQSTGLAAHRRAPQSIGRSFVQSIILVTSAALLALLISAYVFVFEPYRGQIATAQLNLVAQKVQAELHTLVLRVEAVAKLRRDYGRSGLIDLDHVNQLVKLFAPYLLRGPNVSSMAIAQETGHEVLLLAQADGQWMTRVSQPEHRKGKALFQIWNSDYALVKEEMRDTDYDARQRPWFVDALARPGTDAVYWTAPYVFRSTQLPGLSAVVRWTDPKGRRFISSTDVGLLDLSRFTRELVVSRHGFASVFTDDGLIIGVPNDERFASDDRMKAAILRPVASLGIPALTEGYRAWREHGTIEGSDERFIVAGAAWLASFSRVPVGGRSLWVGTYAPEADFFLLAARQALILLLLMVVTLGLAWWGAIRLAAAYARPLAQLAQESERIGRLKLDRPVQVRGRWQEVRAMAQSQEAMRQRLLIAFEVVHASERRANEGELRLRTLSNNLPNCIVYQVVQESDGTLRFTYISEAFERLIGIPVADALGDSSLLYRRIHPDDLPKLRSTRQWSAQNMKVFDLDVRVRHVDGRERWVNLVAAPRRLADGRICWDGVQTDITERRATERALVQYQLELIELTHQLMAQEKDTASRLAQILHDQLGQTLTAMRIDFVGDARFADPADNARHARVDRLIDQAVREVRQVLVELRPTVLDERGLVEALDNELRIRRPTLDGLHLLLDAPAQLATQRWNTDVEYAAFMVAREAIANALQHAKATLVRVTLSGDAHTLRLEVTDNGAGFASDTPAARPGHLGMVGMRERSIAIGARFEVRSSPDGGTSVCLAWEDGPS